MLGKIHQLMYSRFLNIEHEYCNSGVAYGRILVQIKQTIKARFASILTYKQKNKTRI